MIRHLPWYWRVATQWERNATKFEADFPRIDRWVDDFMQRDLTGESDAALFSEARNIWYARVLKYINYHASATSLSLSAYTQMETLMEKRMGDRTLAQTLAGGLTGVIAAEMAPALWEMAETLRRLGLEQLLIEVESDAALAALRTEPATQPFFDQFDRFLQRHGHRCMVEAELLYPRWIEEPAQVIESLAGYLRLSEAPPTAVDGMAEQKRMEITGLVECKLNRFQRSSFRRALKRLHRFTRLRDNGQNYLVKLMLPMRHLYAVLGERWAARGWLTTPEAIFFLVQAEIGTVSIAGDPAAIGLDLQAIADSRRMAYDHWFGQPTPDALDAHGKPVAAIGTSWADETTMVGIPASPGQKTGRARVVMSPREAVRLEPGDILVTRATDPGWTPVFSVIGGAVIEIGGMLSHGAIVAREYGLPAVVNVPQATQRIQDGQTITVDGTTGRVSWAKLE